MAAKHPSPKTSVILARCQESPMICILVSLSNIINMADARELNLV
jgi:hypothetical protein